MINQRITIRLPQTNLNLLDLFVGVGEFSSRSEIIRYALNDFIKNHTDEIIQKVEKIKMVQHLDMAAKTVNPCIINE